MASTSCICQQTLYLHKHHLHNVLYFLMMIRLLDPYLNLVNTDRTHFRYPAVILSESQEGPNPTASQTLTQTPDAEILKAKQVAQNPSGLLIVTFPPQLHVRFPGFVVTIATPSTVSLWVDALQPWYKFCRRKRLVSSERQPHKSANIPLFLNRGTSVDQNLAGRQGHICQFRLLKELIRNRRPMIYQSVLDVALRQMMRCNRVAQITQKHRRFSRFSHVVFMFAKCLAVSEKRSVRPDHTLVGCNQV